MAYPQEKKKLYERDQMLEGNYPQMHNPSMMRGEEAGAYDGIEGPQKSNDVKERLRKKRKDKENGSSNSR